MWTAPPLVGSTNAPSASRRQPPFQRVEKVVPSWQTFKGVAAATTSVMWASVGCIANRIPEGLSRKLLRRTAEDDG
jgi:hypothetical protein